MRQDDAHGVAAERFGEQLPDPHRGTRNVADIDRSDGDEPLLPVDHGDDQCLSVAVRKMRRERACGRAG